MKNTRERSSKSSVEGFYNVWGPLYTTLRDFGRYDHEDKSVLIDSLAPFDNDEVLDVGTGPGVYALKIASRSPESHVVGIDISPAFINIAARRASEQKVENLEFALGDIEKLDFQDGRFSKLICAGVISVIGDRRAAVREMARVLMPGGRLAVREPRRADGALARFFVNRPPASRVRRLGSRLGLMFGHFSPDFLTDEELRSLFSDAGFSEVIFRPHGADLIILAVK